MKYAGTRENVYISRDVPIIYPASSATITIVRSMAWYLEHIKNWDYVVVLTGQDYPLMPLSRMEAILGYQSPPMPFLVSGWFCRKLWVGSLVCNVFIYCYALWCRFRWCGIPMSLGIQGEFGMSILYLEMTLKLKLVFERI